MVHSFRNLILTGCGIVLFSLAGEECVTAQKVTYSGNLQYSTGSYFFTEKTESFYFSNGLSVSGERARISFTIPYVVQSSPWISYGTSGGIPTGGTGHGQVGQHGSGTGNQYQDLARRGRHRVDLPDTVSYRQASFSDPSIFGSLQIFNSSAQTTNLNLNASAKLPFTKPASGFGTGAWDFGAGISLFHRIQTMFLFLDTMYWRMGDMNDLDLINPLTGSAGAGKAFKGGEWMVNASISGSTKIIGSVDPPLNLNTGLGYLKSQKTSLNTTFSFGLSESSPDFTASVGWSIQF